MQHDEIVAELNAIIEKHGEWNYDLPLKYGIWTNGNKNIPHTRLKRVVQIASDFSKRDFRNLRVLDLGCLDGIFSIEFALQGAETVGIDIREDNIVKCNFYKKVVGLENVKFIQDDVRNVNKEKYGTFDIVICSGILYHLDIPDSFILLENLYEMASELVITDTLISLSTTTSAFYKDREYFGHIYTEFPEDTSENDQLKLRLAAFKNPRSFWFSRPSLINFLHFCGFTSVFECYNQMHIKFRSEDRCTFVAVKGRKINLVASPAANEFNDYWPEGSLSYYKNNESKKTINTISKIKRVIKSRSKKFLSR
jgi:SAM-dependent methyltransferase